MKLRIDYLQYLKRQSDLILRLLEGESDNGECQKIFTDVCEFLSNDFLPPINREDIASLSYSLLAIGMAASDNFNNARNIETYEIIKMFPTILEALFTKKKTCERDIHRLIKQNFVYNKVLSDKSDCLNKAVTDFIGIILNAYFKNL